MSKMGNGLERRDAVVIGGSQAGLAVGYHLKQHELDFEILDAADRVGDAWRRRWDSLRLFTPAQYDSLPGMLFPAPKWTYPNKEQVADYLEEYAARFDLPIRLRTRVERVARGAVDTFVVATHDREIEANAVVVASGAWNEPLVPDFAGELDRSIMQLHSSEYRQPSQLRDGPVMVVGASNSGAEIALDVAREHPTILVGRNTGQFPFDLEGYADRLVTPFIWFAANRLLTTGNPIGRKLRAQERVHGEPVERARPKRLIAAGVDRRYARAVGVRDGFPVLENGDVVEVANVIWATGFRRDFSWIDLPVFDDDGWPLEDHGVVASEPGLYFVGMPFQRAMASGLLGGVGRDAGEIVQHLVAHAAEIPAPPDRNMGSVPNPERA